MAHNIETAAEYCNRTRPGTGGRADTDVWRNPVLVVADTSHRTQDATVAFLFQHQSQMLVVNPWDEETKPVTIARQDLFALRELLNAMPEEAFERPADPVEVPEWADGDIVVESWTNSDHRSRIWRRDDEGHWRSDTPTTRAHIFDKEVEDSIKYGSHQWVVVRKGGVDQ